MSIRTQAGAGLIEIAVALLVLSVAALGLARGQLAARQVAGEALLRSEALVLGAGLLDQVRANPDAFLGYQSSDIGRVSLPEHDCSQLSCSAAQWGAWSLWNWLQGIGESGVPRACLSVGAEVTVLEISWRLLPSGSDHSCDEASPPPGIYLLSLDAHPGGVAL